MKTNVFFKKKTRSKDDRNFFEDRGMGTAQKKGGGERVTVREKCSLTKKLGS